MNRSIVLKGREISYELQRKAVKNLNLRIKADCSVYLSANQTVSDPVIEEFLIAKADYILRALDRYAEQARYVPKPKQYIDGETFRIFGHDLRLRVISGKQNMVTSDESFITLSVKDRSDAALKKKVLDQWVTMRCRDTVERLCRAVYPKFQKYGIAFPQIRFRNMVSRWGSCQPKRGILTFNYALAEAPIACIEYVVVHEFTHFLQANHSKEFYRHLSMFMPDWRERKRMLEQTRYSEC